MNLQSKTFQLRDNKSTTTSQQNELFLPKMPSPSMFDDDLISIGLPTQPGQSYAVNQEITNLDSLLPSQWTPNFNIPSGTGYAIAPKSDQETIFLSISPIERVNICGMCDYTTDLNESNDCHNRTVADVSLIDGSKGDLEDNLVGPELESERKRARLSETPGMAPDVAKTETSAEVSDMLGKLAESTRVINNQLMSLHEDCGKHLMMAKSIAGPMEV